MSKNKKGKSLEESKSNNASSQNIPTKNAIVIDELRMRPIEI